MQTSHEHDNTDFTSAMKALMLHGSCRGGHQGEGQGEQHTGAGRQKQVTTRACYNLLGMESDLLLAATLGRQTHTDGHSVFFHRDERGTFKVDNNQSGLSSSEPGLQGCRAQCHAHACNHAGGYSSSESEVRSSVEHAGNLGCWV